MRTIYSKEHYDRLLALGNCNLVGSALADYKATLKEEYERFKAVNGDVV